MKGKSLLAVVLSLGLAYSTMAAGAPTTSTPGKLGNYELGVKAVKAANYGQAIKLLRRVVAADPNNADAWNYIGFSRRNLRQVDQALAAYQKALAIDPDHRGANEYLGELYLQMGDLAKARERLKKLDDVCYFGFFGCEEFDDLKAAIKAYEGGRWVGPTVAAAVADEGAIKYRQSIMKANGAHLGAIVAILKGEVAFTEDLKAHAHAVAELSKIVPKLFPAGSDVGDTRALPAIWEKPEEFKKVLNAFRTEAAKLAKDAESGDMQAIGAQVGALGNACGACHKRFREKR